MNTLTLDIGNGSVKEDLWHSDGSPERLFNGEPEIKRVLKTIRDRGIEGVIISSVRKEDNDFTRSLIEEAGCKVVNFDIDEMRSHYDLRNYRGNLGSDRLAAFIGAEVLYPGVSKLIIDIGTAMTIDVGKDGTFMGGNISMGLQNRMDSLSKTTSRLPHLEGINESEPFGKDTASAIRSGAINGVVGEILYSIELAKQAYDIKMVMITGGDAPKVLGRLSSDIKIIADEYLVGRGLDYHLRTRHIDNR